MKILTISTTIILLLIYNYTYSQFIYHNSGPELFNKGYLLEARPKKLSAWTQLESGTTNLLWKIVFVNSETGYIVGFNGTVLRTNNAGMNWTSLIAVDSAYSLEGLHFIDESTGFISGGIVGDSKHSIIKKTTDAGNNWSSVQNGAYKFIMSVFFPFAQIGYAVGDDKLFLKSTDYGETWTKKTVPTDMFKYPKYYDYHLNCVYFNDTYTGFAVSETNGNYLKTTDGGDHWFWESPWYTKPLYSIYFINSYTGFAVGNDGCIIKTTAAIDQSGADDLRWRWIKTPTMNRLYSIHFPNESTGYTVGDNGTILKSTDGGDNWYYLKCPGIGVSNLRGVFFTTTRIGYVVGENGIIYKTETGGE